MNMEYLNKVELIGTIGSVSKRNVCGINHCRFSVETNYTYKGVTTPVIETTWTQVVAFEGGAIEELPNLEKGDKVHVVGRLRSARFTDTNGNDVVSYEVVAKTLEKV